MTSTQAVLLELDGEPLGGLPLEVEIVPRALAVITRPNRG